MDVTCMPRSGAAPTLVAALLGVIAVAGCTSTRPFVDPVTIPHPRGYVACKTATPIVVDGLLDDPIWEASPWTEDFGDIEGTLRPMPRYRTRAKMAWDDEYLYIAADLEEPDVWGTLTKRDTVIFYDNDFEVFIDPNGDNHEYYEFEMNALNTVWDLFLPKPYKDSGSAVDSWNIEGLKTAVHVDGTINKAGDTDRGWTVEIAMPWKALAQYAHCASPPNAGDQWRINFSRVEWKTVVKGGMYLKVPNTPEDNWIWSPQWLIDMHRPERWGYVQFSIAAPGVDKFRQDVTWPARMALIRLYNAERAYHEKHTRFSTSLSELGIEHGWKDVVPTVVLTDDGYVGTAQTSAEAMHVDRFSRLWGDGK